MCAGSGILLFITAAQSSEKFKWPFLKTSATVKRTDVRKDEERNPDGCQPEGKTAEAARSPRWERPPGMLTQPLGSQPGVRCTRARGTGNGILVARGVRPYQDSTVPRPGELLPGAERRLGQQNKEGASVPQGAAGLQNSYSGPSARPPPLFRVPAPAEEEGEAGRGSAAREPVGCGRRAELQHFVVCFLLETPERARAAPRSGGPAPHRRRVCSAPRAPVGRAGQARPAVTYALIQLDLHLLLGDALLDPLAEAGVARRPAAPLAVLAQTAQLPRARPGRSRGPRRRDPPGARHLGPSARSGPVPGRGGGGGGGSGDHGGHGGGRVPAAAHVLGREAIHVPTLAAPR